MSAWLLNLVYAITAGLMVGIGFIVPLLWPLVLVGFVPLFWVIRSSSYGGASVLLSVAGLVAYGIVFSFVWTVLPLDWIRVPHFPALLFVSLAWGISVTTFVIPFVLWGLVVRWTNLLNSVYGMLIIPLLWVISECLATYLYSIVNTGPGSLWGIHMSFAFVGNLLANDSALLQLASLGGVFVLSAVVMGINVGVWLLMTKRGAVVYKGALVGVVIGVWAGATLLYAPSSNDSLGKSRTLTMAAMSIYPNDHTDARGVLDHAWLAQALESASSHPLDIVVFPEGHGIFNPRLEDFLTAVKSTPPDQVDMNRTVYIVSGQYRDDAGITSNALYVQNSAVIATSSKYFIMPIGEYIPALYHTAFSLLSNDTYTQAAQKLRGYVSGPRSGPVLVHDVPVATLFCNEVMSPLLYAREAYAGAQVLINISSNGWFHGSSLATHNLLNIAKVRAVENRRWYVQSSIDAPARVIDPYGREVSMHSAGQTSVAPYVVTLRTDTTWYTTLVHLFTE